MQEPLKHFPVNWIDGMKINKNHFLQQERAFVDQLKDITSLGLHQNNYGLLPPYFGKGSSIKIVLIGLHPLAITAPPLPIIPQMFCPEITRFGSDRGTNCGRRVWRGVTRSGARCNRG